MNKNKKEYKYKYLPFLGTRAPKKNNMEKGKNDLINQLIWILPALCFVALFSYFAFFIVVRQGLNEDGGIGDFTFSLFWFRRLFTEDSKGFIIALQNTFLYVAISIPLSLLISLFTARALVGIMNKRVFAFFQTIFFLPYVTSSLAIGMAFSLMFSNLDTSLLNQLLKYFGIPFINWRAPQNARIMLIIFGVWRMLPFKIIMFTSGFLKVDRRLYQAASIDGTPKWKQFWTISIPQVMPIIIYMITTGIIGSFKFMPLGLFSSYLDAEKSKAQTIVFYIFFQTGKNAYGLGGAASIFLMMLILVITIFNKKLSKFLRKKYT